MPEGSTDEEIRLAFRQLARVVHPDKNRDPRAGEAFAKVQQVTITLNILPIPMNRLNNDILSGIQRPVQRSIKFSATNVLDILRRTVSTKVVP